MKNIVYVLILLFLCQACYAVSFGDVSSSYSRNAMQRARYYPQYSYANRYRQSRKNYIFTPQQARYYGYRTPQQRTPYYMNRGYGYNR